MNRCTLSISLMTHDAVSWRAVNVNYKLCKKRKYVIKEIRPSLAINLLLGTYLGNMIS